MMFWADPNDFTYIHVAGINDLIGKLHWKVIENNILCIIEDDNKIKKA